MSNKEIKKIVGNIRQNLSDYIRDSKLKSLVIGISGGIDSTLCAVLAQPVCRELNISLIGRSLPAGSSTQDEIDRANDVGNYFCTDFGEFNIQPLFETVGFQFNDGYVTNDFLNKKRVIQNGNIKARLRMIYLYDLASSTGGMVLSTDNYTEYLLGFWTLHGDVGDYGMIQNLWKTEVYDIGEYLADNELVNPASYIVHKVIEADATDGLGISKTDLDQLLPDWEGNSRDGYKEVDRRLQDHIETWIGDLGDPVLQRYYRTQFKRNNPYNIPREKIFNLNV